jgi:hypothetical protein
MKAFVSQGLIIRRKGELYAPSLAHTEFITRVNQLLVSPPQKYPSDTIQNNPKQSNTHKQSISYSCMLCAQMTCIQSVEVASTVLLPPLPHKHPKTIMAVVEASFQAIEMEVQAQRFTQNRMDMWLIEVDKQTTKISDYVTALMSHLQVQSSARYKAPSKQSERVHSFDMEDVGNANQPTSLDYHTMGDAYF